MRINKEEKQMKENKTEKTKKIAQSGGENRKDHAIQH